MTLEHLTTVTAAEGDLNDDGETWTIRLVDPRRTAYGIQRVHEVDPRRVPMHVLEAVMVWAHAGLNPDIDDATDPPTEDIVDAEIVEEAGFYCVACLHPAHAPRACEGVYGGAHGWAHCACTSMVEAPRS
ncbi:hypothetical protein QLQ78_gp47 [Gordonia phage Jojo24]|uniref:Uncharacterized protein n=1 Tax=Gordonia phage Jojo24 TaxID=2859476 RepID=A0AAE7SNA1_9CAUD|nr:hypothetical protein QLQ78_gp47 [Gordonia phage Jojo24]QXO13144.1 hypothetical protein SEA_JOJO24_47 [Gordonia phage Jojo24]